MALHTKKFEGLHIFMLLPKYMLCLYKEEKETVVFLGWKPMYKGEKEFKQ